MTSHTVEFGYFPGKNCAANAAPLQTFPTFKAARAYAKQWAWRYITCAEQAGTHCWPYRFTYLRCFVRIVPSNRKYATAVWSFEAGAKVMVSLGIYTGAACPHVVAVSVIMADWYKALSTPDRRRMFENFRGSYAGFECFSARAPLPG